LLNLGVTSLVAPMIETAFAMDKYMESLPNNRFRHVGVTIETITAVNNIAEIIAAGNKLTEITIGRTDLTASYKGSGVDSAQTMEMVSKVARLAKEKGLKVTMGGSINKGTRELLLKDAEIVGLLDYVETRKVVMPIHKFLEEDGLTNALRLEVFLLNRRIAASEEITALAIKRKNAIISRG